jgi:hypothetical protein
VLGSQVANRLVVTKVVGVVPPNPIFGCFLIGQYLPGEQGQSLTGQGTLCRYKPTRRDASGLYAFRDAASDFHGRWDGAWFQARGRRSAESSLH